MTAAPDHSADPIEVMAAALRERNDRWAALFETGVAIAENVDSGNLLEDIVRRSMELLHVGNGGLFLPDRERGDLVIAVDGRLVQKQSMVGTHIRYDEGVAGRVFTSGKALVINDYLEWSGRKLLPNTNDPTAVAGAPLFSSGEVIGTLLVLDDTGTRQFSEDDLQTLVFFSQQASVVLGRARARRQAEALAVSEERARLAQDLHDGLAQDLASLHLRADLCRTLCDDGACGDNGALLQENLAVLSEGLQRAIREARATIFALRKPDQGQASLAEALGALKNRFESQIGIPVLLEVTGDGTTALPEQHRMAILRFAHEALTNVRKHAGASEVHVRLDCDGGEAIGVCVADDGRGFDPTAAMAAATEGDLRFGLLSLRDRIEGLGGEFTVESAPGCGTRVCVRLPIHGAGR
jgi:signal transduction histidine kinase